MTLNTINECIIITHAHGFVPVKKYWGDGCLAAPYSTSMYKLENASKKFTSTTSPMEASLLVSLSSPRVRTPSLFRSMALKASSLMMGRLMNSSTLILPFLFLGKCPKILKTCKIPQNNKSCQKLEALPVLEICQSCS